MNSYQGEIYKTHKENPKCDLIFVFGMLNIIEQKIHLLLCLTVMGNCINIK